MASRITTHSSSACIVDITGLATGTQVGINRPSASRSVFLGVCSQALVKPDCDSHLFDVRQDFNQKANILTDFIVSNRPRWVRHTRRQVLLSKLIVVQRDADLSKIV